MKKILMLAFISAFIIPLQAQIIDLDEIVNKTERKIERRIERGANRAVDRGLDKAEDGISGRNRSDKYDDEYYESPSRTVEKDVEELPVNQFVGKLNLDVTLNNTEGQSLTLTFRYISTPTSSILIPEDGGYDDIDFIYVNNSNKSVIVAKNIDGDKSGTKDWFRYFEELDSESYTSQRTDETQLLHGFICRKYELDTEDSQVINWVSPEIQLDYSKFLMELNYLDLIDQNLHELNPETQAVMDASIELFSGDVIDMRIRDVEFGNYDFSNYDVSQYRLLDYTEY